MHGDYDYGDEKVPTTTSSTIVAAPVSGSKQGHSGINEDDDEAEEEDEEEEGDMEEEGVEDDRAELSDAVVDAAEALALAALELRAREDKAAMDRLVVAMAGEGVVVWRHQSGFHKELVRRDAVCVVLLKPTLASHL